MEASSSIGNGETANESLATDMKRKPRNEDGASSPKRRRDSSNSKTETIILPPITEEEDDSETQDEQGTINRLTDSQETIEFDLEPESPDHLDDAPGCSKDSPKSQENGCIEKPAIGKIASIQRDSEIIADILEVGKDKIYDKLLRKRAAPNRIELVTNELLEGVTNEEEPRADISNGEGEQSSSEAALIADVEWVCSQIKQQDSDAEVDPNKVFVLLESNNNKSDRRMSVLQQLTKKSQCETSGGIPDLLTDVSTIMAVYPKADANAVYGMLESQKNQSKRVECVLHILRGRYGDGDPQPVLADGVVDATNDPLHADVMVLAQMFPNKHHDELYAYLQAHRDKPNRLQIVNKELLRRDEFEESPQFERSWSITSEGSFSGGHFQDLHERSGGPSRKVDRELELLCSVYPLCDPNYIFERLEAYQHEKDRVQLVSHELENDPTYPRRKDTESKLKRQADLQRMQDLDANIEDLLSAYPDITDHFYSSENSVSENYKKHLKAQLEYDFPWLKSSFLDRVSKAHNYHLLPTYRQLQGLRPYDVRHNCRKLVRQIVNNRDHPEYPDELDKNFFMELLFTMEESKISARIREQKEEKNRRFEEAKSLGLLQECGCCYDDEVLMEDMLSCPEGHMFCKLCVRRSTEVLVGEARAKYPCLTGNCESSFNLSVIQNAVSPKTYALVLRRIQEEELREAGIENLVTCPFCSFATIMENPDDKVFKCLNPECMKESCRLCQDESHIPLRCEEVEKKSETDMRTYIENKMTEAMVRTCYRCKKRFYKITGCNHMTCVCGASMCYVCRMPFDGTSEHLNGDGRCSNSNAEEIHRREVEEAFQKARESYLHDHPEAAEIVLKYDPHQHLEPGLDLRKKAPKGYQYVGVTDIDFRGDWWQEREEENSSDEDND